ncbi:MAG: DegV family protein [Bacillota bacterium]
MNSTIGVVACTNACLDYIDHPHDIRILRSRIHLGDEEFIDYEELTATEFYDRLNSDSSLFPRTAQPPIYEMEETFKALRDEGKQDIIVVTISSQMSGIYSSAKVAGDNVEGVSVHVFDSKTVAYPEAMMAITASKMAEKGHDVRTILTKLETIRAKNHMVFAVETLAYLVKNGRLSNAAGFMGSMLKIKPLLHVSEEGRVENIEKIRTFKKALNRVVDAYLEETRAKEVLPFIAHANNESARDYIVSRLKTADPTIESVPDIPLTPAVGAHGGPGAIALGYIEKSALE